LATLSLPFPGHVHGWRMGSLRLAKRLKIMRSERSQAGLPQQLYHQRDGVAALHVDFSFGTTDVCKVRLTPT
jgi:hypothetical protein